MHCFRRSSRLSDLRSILLSTVLMWLITTAGCTRPPEILELKGQTMGTTYSVKVALPRHPAAELQAAVDARLESVNAQMSTWLPDSEISRFNASTSTDWQPVSADFFQVTRRALELGRLTGGALDISVMPLVDLWGFGPAFTPDAVPEESAIAAILPHVGRDKLEAEGGALRKPDPETTIDLSAIAKGFGVDAVAQTLSSLGYRDYLVEIGGEVRGSGTRPDGETWRIAVERPAEGERSVQLIVPLRDAAIATSGDYRNYFELNGRRYAHIIDPHTGRPPENGVASVSVVTADTTTADGLATGLMVMGADAGLAMAQREELAVLFILHGPTGLETRASPAFEALTTGQ